MITILIRLEEQTDSVLEISVDTPSGRASPSEIKVGKELMDMLATFKSESAIKLIIDGREEDGE